VRSWSLLVRCRGACWAGGGGADYVLMVKHGMVHVKYSERRGEHFIIN
jgi:hypothetical protein